METCPSFEPHWPSPLEATSQTGSTFTSTSHIRLVLYSHDTMGLGHIRRNLTIARLLREHYAELDILLVTGAVEARSFDMPDGVDCLVLPALYKEHTGHYRARRLSMDLDGIIKLRSCALHAAIEAFDPHIMVVDNVPRGVAGELDQTLEYLSHRDTRCVLGLRDIRDDPEIANAEWHGLDCANTIDDCYDQIWIYGDQKVYDQAAEHDYPNWLADRIRYTGYLDRCSGDQLPSDDRLPNEPKGPFVLCMVGGGQDGEALANAFAEAKFPDGITGVLITGPHMASGTRQRLEQRTQERQDLMVHAFVKEPVRLLSRAACIISMGGYNSVSESLSHDKPVLIVPRVAPRREQLIRAQRLAKMQLADMLHPDQLCSNKLTQWIENSTDRARIDRRKHIDLNGAFHLPRLFRELLDSPCFPNFATQRCTSIVK